MSYATSTSVKEVHCGVLTKMGGNIKSWRKRWMVLKSDQTLQYFKEPSKPSLGTIHLSDPKFNVMAGSRSDCSWPKTCNIECSLVIMTSGRTYFMFADNVEEADEWLKQLEKYSSGGKTTKGSLPSRYNKIGGNALDLETPTAVPVSDSQKPKMYKKKERRMPTKRFNSVGGKQDKEGEEEDISDDDSGEVLDGELDTHRFNTVSSEISITSSLTPEVEGIYALAGQTEEKPPPPRMISPNSNNNNGSEHFSSSVDVHESLYDLVGRINAGEEEEKETKNELKEVQHSGTADLSHGQDTYEIILQDQEQDVYEPMSEPNSPMTTPIHKITTPNCRMNSFNVSHSLPAVCKTSSLGFHAALPKEASLDLYEPVENPVVEGVVYEEIDQRNAGLPESDSGDEEKETVSSSSVTTGLPSKPLPLPRAYRPFVPPYQDRNSRGSEGNGISHNTPPTLPLKPPPPLPKETLGTTHNNTPPSLCILSPSPELFSEHNDDMQFYDNAPSLPLKPFGSPATSPTHKTQRVLKSPVPTPRNSVTNHCSEDSEDIYDDTVAIVTSISQPVSSKPKQPVDEEKPSSTDILECAESESVGKDTQECISVKTVQSTEPNTTDTVTTETDLSGKPVNYSSLQKKGSLRPASATISGHDQGIAMFKKRAQTAISTATVQDDGIKQLLLADTESLNTKEKTTLAESLREVEMEKLLASEERFRWERERLKLGEERKRFEEEKRRFQEQMRKLQKLEQAKS